MDLTEEEYIKNRRKEHPEELYKKDLHDLDNHNGVITQYGSKFAKLSSGRRTGKGVLILIPKKGSA